MTDFNKCARVKRFQSNFNIKDTIWSAAKAWDKVDKDALIPG
jgi:hypothetical protein